MCTLICVHKNWAHLIYDICNEMWQIVKVVLPITLFESENKWQKIEQVPLQLPRASRNFSNLKTRNKKIL